MEREIRQRKELCSGPGVEGFSGLSLHLTYLLPHSLEGPPSYKPPTPKAKLEEPEMVSTSPGARLPPHPHTTFATEAGAGRGDWWGEAVWEGGWS